MAANVYYSSSPFGSGDIKVASNISIAGGAGAATFSVAQTGNIGVGCHVISSGIDGFISEMTDSTHATIVTALGVAHGNVTSETLTSIAHEYASISAYEAGFTDASHINDTDLTNADVAAFCPCYYDHDDQTLDTTATQISFGTTGATQYLQFYTPMGGTESINNQRHSGVWDANKWALDISASGGGPLNIDESFVRIIGLQVRHQATSLNRKVIDIFSTGTTSYKVYSNIVRGDAASTGVTDGIFTGSGGVTAEIWNNVGYDFTGAGILTNFTHTDTTIYHNTIHNSVSGFDLNSKNPTAKNNIGQSNTTDYANIASATTSNNVDEDGTGDITGAVAFTDEANDDFSLASGDTVAAGAGTDLTGTVDVDIIGTARSSSPSCGAFELVAAAGGLPAGSLSLMGVGI